LKKETNMTEKEDDDTGSGRRRAAKPKVETPKPKSDRPKRKAEPPTLTDDLTGKFLRVGNKLYRTSDDKRPIAKLEPDRLKTSNIDALPDIVRIAKANGWTSLRINGGDKFKKAAFLAAAAHGLTVENYTPSKVAQAEADRLQARLAEREQRREAKSTTSKSRQPPEEAIRLKALSDRFLNQTHEQNARDPELRSAQSLVAQTISSARARYPDDPVKAARDIESKRQAVAARIAKGANIAALQVRNQQTKNVHEITQDKALQRGGRSR
jgi:hypothetical protein